MNRAVLAILITFAAAIMAGCASADCSLNAKTMPVTMRDLRATVPVKVNDADAIFALDSGAFYSMMSQAKAAEYNLPLRPLPESFVARALGGEVRLSMTTVKVFTVADVKLQNIQFLVGGSTVGEDVTGLLGQNILGLADVEYDFASGVVRIMSPRGACGHTMFAYWTKTSPYSVMNIQTASPADHSMARRFTIGEATVNGIHVRAQFDTGAPLSMITLRAAQRAGVDVKGSGVADGIAGGLGRGVYRQWIAPVTNFKIGDEQIMNTHLRVADTTMEDDVDMLIGADFFLSHHVYVANSQGKLYFTYNGGPVFNLTGKSTPTAIEAKAEESGGALLDADGFARRGAAFESRRDYGNSIDDFTRAILLKPSEPRFLRERGAAYLWSGQSPQAAADFDQALKLKPDDIDALLLRAQLRLSAHDLLRALADLDAADYLATKGADVRLMLGQLYDRADAFPRAIGQYDLWIKAHPGDSIGMQAEALNGRCWARALLGQDLRMALADCDAVVRMFPKGAEGLDSRGLVRLRLGDYDKAIADYNAALAIDPKLSWSFYGRGIARSRVGKTAEGHADIAAAIALRPGLPDEAKSHGITP